MASFRQAIALTAGATLLAAPTAVLTASPAQAADREFRCGGAEVDFEVSRDDGRFEVEVDVDEARAGSRWRVVLRHNGKRFHNRVHRATGGDFEVERERRNTRGKDRFKLRIKRVGSGKACSRTIRVR